MQRLALLDSRSREREEISINIEIIFKKMILQEFEKKRYENENFCEEQTNKY